MVSEKEIIQAVKRIRDTAMEQTLAARIPECGEFGAIAQDADWLFDTLSAAARVRAEANNECGEAAHPAPQPSGMVKALSFDALRHANNERQKEWPGNEHTDVAFRAIEVAGEAGEVLEAVKKFLRAERGIRGSTATTKDIASEMADTIIALDLLANQIGVDLGAAVAKKFNATSEKYGLATRLSALTAGKPEPNGRPETVDSMLLDALRKIASTDLSGCADMTTAEIFGALSRMHETARVAVETAERILGRDEGR